MLSKLQGRRRENGQAIAKLAEAGKNKLRGVIDNAYFNDESKLGSGKEIADKLTRLSAVFQRVDGDDVLGDAYEYILSKSKGQILHPRGGAGRPPSGALAIRLRGTDFAGAVSGFLNGPFFRARRQTAAALLSFREPKHTSFLKIEIP